MTTRALMPPSLAPVAPAPSKFAQAVPLLLGLDAVASFAVAFKQAWWRFVLYAPQYPRGLRLEISLTGLAGDVHEVGMLNHYIGMKHLEDAATLERQYAGVGVALVACLAFAGIFLRGKRFRTWPALLGALLPLGFLLDSFYWLYRFGHELDPHAPVHIPGFTPQLFGGGQIGQFMTFAQPAAGFWWAVGGAVTFAAATLLRQHLSEAR